MVDDISTEEAKDVLVKAVLTLEVSMGEFMCACWIQCMQWKLNIETSKFWNMIVIYWEMRNPESIDVCS